MTSTESENETTNSAMECTPPEMREEAKLAMDNFLPSKSKKNVTEMRIRSFSKLVEVGELHPLVLQDTTVVVDAMNFFFETYQESGLQGQLGCECQRYTNYLKRYLSMFTRANIKCYFLFRGGHRPDKLEQRTNRVRDLRATNPIFTSSLYKEVLDQMGFQYVTCEYDSIRDAIALAQTLDCPVISFDVKFCFSGVNYIPRNQLRFNEHNNTIECRYFSLENFMQKYNLTAEKLALFIVLSDEEIFPRDFFFNFFRNIRAEADQNDFKRNVRLLAWLSTNDRSSLSVLLRFMSAEDRQKFNEEVGKVEEMIGRQEEGGLGAACALNRGACAVTRGDPLWFPKGVAANHITTSYINLYRSKRYFGNHAVKRDDPVPFYLEIVKYAFDLLTDFQNDGFTFVYDTDYKDSGRETIIVAENYSIRKPVYEASVSVFENGWEDVRELGLFDHFLKETLQRQDLESLAELPKDARILVAALVYFSRKKTIDTSSDSEAACVLLSYVALSVVLDKCDKANLPQPPFAPRPVLNSTTDKTTITVVDCNMAAAIMAGSLTNTEDRLDRATLDLLTEFQQCLVELNDLNALCGGAWSRTVLSRTYSGSLAYRLRRAVSAAGDARTFLDGLLSPAPTVYAFFNGLFEVYQQMKR